ncbi:Uncharacterized protein SCF082_LOCUS3909 [Durusdinium trenchii]|uniref:Uncharacterized protein n=1 Tax=Durusdinium trenchii TaxID=1381693 RepID=A0ABP0HW01_9DINO
MKRRTKPSLTSAGVAGSAQATSGKTLEVIVKEISVEKGSVKIVFAENEKIWKTIPISTITSKDNPLLGQWGTEQRDRSRSPAR